jgi:hypothetical protein
MGPEQIQRRFLPIGGFSHEQRAADGEAQVPEISANIPNSLKTALDEEAARSGRGVSTLIAAALAQYLQRPIHTVFQVSTSGALVAGVYDREVSVQAILQHGNFGLGTFANLDGEMVVIDGRVYQVKGSGQVPPARLSPLSLGSSRKPTHQSPRSPASMICKRAATASGGPETSSTPSGSTDSSSACEPEP